MKTEDALMGLLLVMCTVVVAVAVVILITAHVEPVTVVHAATHIAQTAAPAVARTAA